MADKEEKVERPVDRGTLILVRNAECEFNEQNLFCGWYDSPLTPGGLDQTKEAAAMIKKKKFRIDTCHVSLMDRAKDTASGILEELGYTDVKIQATWRLNPKHYGALTSWNKNELAGKYGEEQVMLWRRSWAVPPPPITLNHHYFYELCDDHRYAEIEELADSNFPRTETLKQVLQRILPYWTDVLTPELREAKVVLVVAHCNTIRALMKHIDGIAEEDLYNLHVPNAIPLSYDLFVRSLRPCGPMRYLTDESTVQKKLEKVINQGKVLSLKPPHDNTETTDKRNTSLSMREKTKTSIDMKDKPKSSVDMKDKPKTSVDMKDKPKTSVQIMDKPKTSD